MNILQKIADVLQISIVDFFEYKKNGIEIQTINEPLLQKVKLIEELDEIQRTSIFTLIDTAIANKRLKEALSNAMNIAM